MYSQVEGDVLELIGEEGSMERGDRPESFRRRKPAPRTRRRARRSRSNDMAKRGMHQRRNKRSAW